MQKLEKKFADLKKLSTFAIPFAEWEPIFENIGKKSTSKYRETKKSRALILLESEASGIKLRSIKKYTKKSLILAQDER